MTKPHNKPVALLLLSPQQADGVIGKSNYVSHLKTWNLRSKLRGIHRFANKLSEKRVMSNVGITPQSYRKYNYTQRSCRLVST